MVVPQDQIVSLAEEKVLGISVKNMTRSTEGVASFQERLVKFSA
ncbi:MAG: hypothetical protein ACI8ZB_002248 [Desulforhopalus sp.]